MSDTLPTRGRTPEFIASYTHIFKPQKNDDGMERWSIRMIFPEETNLAGLKQLAFNAAINEYGEEEANRLIKNGLIYWPFRDGNKLKTPDPNCKDRIFVGAGTVTRRPEVVAVIDGQLVPLSSVNEFYAGCICMATVNFYCFKKKGNEGVTCGLDNVMKIRDGERIGGGGASAAEDFKDFADQVAGSGGGSAVPDILG